MIATMLPKPAHNGPVTVTIPVEACATVQEWRVLVVARFLAAGVPVESGRIVRGTISMQQDYTRLAVLYRWEP